MLSSCCLLVGVFSWRAKGGKRVAGRACFRNLKLFRTALTLQNLHIPAPRCLRQISWFILLFTGLVFRCPKGEFSIFRSRRCMIKRRTTTWKTQNFPAGSTTFSACKPIKPAPHNSTSNSWPAQTESNNLIRKSLPPKMIGLIQLSAGFDSDAVFSVLFYDDFFRIMILHPITWSCPFDVNIEIVTRCRAEVYVCWQWYLHCTFWRGLK